VLLKLSEGTGVGKSCNRKAKKAWRSLMSTKDTLKQESYKGSSDRGGTVKTTCELKSIQLEYGGLDQKSGGGRTISEAIGDGEEQDQKKSV